MQKPLHLPYRKHNEIDGSLIKLPFIFCDLWRTQFVGWCLKQAASDGYIGNIEGVRRNTRKKKRTSRKQAQKLSNWSFGKVKKHLTYKLAPHGIRMHEIKYIKIDRSLIHRIDRDKMKEILVETLTVFAQKINCQMIAEGIETFEELEVVRRLGVHFGQGYLLGRPNPKLQPASDAVVEWIQRHSSN